MNLTEQELLRGCLNKQPQIQELLYSKYCNTMLAICYRYARNKEDAEDMMQDGFIKVFSQIEKFRNEGSLEGWIKVIMVHTCINALKKNKKFNDILDLESADENLFDKHSIQSKMEAQQIVEAIRILPTGYKTILNLFAIEGYSHKEIADMLDIKESTSRSQYTRARTFLHRILVEKNIISREEFITKPSTTYEQ